MSVVPLAVADGGTVVQTREQFEARGGPGGDAALIQNIDTDQLSGRTSNASYDLRIGGTVPGAPLHMIVADAALYGIHVPTPQWLSQIMAEHGFVDVQCEMIRPRGHRWKLAKRQGSPQGLGEYYVFGRAGQC